MFEFVVSARAVCKENSWKIFSNEFLRLICIFRKHGCILTKPEDCINATNALLGMSAQLKTEILEYKKVKKLKYPNIAVAVIDNHDVNAFATKLSRDKESYLIALNSGLAREFSRIANDKLLIKSIRETLPQLSAVPDSAVIWATLQFLLGFVCFHEFAHVIRGHINFCIASGGDNLVSETDKFEIPLDGAALASYTIESDADNFAGRLLTGVAESFKATAKQNKWLGSSAENNHGFAQLACACAALIMMFFDREPNGDDYTYPIAPIRLSLALGAFTDQLAEKLPEKVALKIAQQGMAAAVAVSQGLKWESQKVDFNAKFAEWRQELLPKIRKASENFKDYYPEHVKASSGN